MQQCSNCGHRNRAGIVFCENCGASLIGKMPVDTKSLDNEEDNQTELAEATRRPEGEKPQGASTFPPGSYLRLELEGSPEPVLFQPKPETIFGRRDPATGAMPDIDLTPFAGYRMGVSRRHAAIRFGDERSLDLWDLGSSNGTFLNGQRLSAHRPYRLHDGDELRLGQMVIRLFFQVAEGAQVTPPLAPAVTVPLTPEDLKPAGETPKLTTEATKPAGEPKPGTPGVAMPQPATAPLEVEEAPEPAAEAAKPPEPAPEREPKPVPEAAKAGEPAPETAPKPAAEAAKAGEPAPEAAPKPAAEAPKPAAPAPEAAPETVAKPVKAPEPAPETAPKPAADATKPAEPAPEAAKPGPEEPKLLEDKAAPEAPKLAPGAEPAGELPPPADASAQPGEPRKGVTKPLPPEPDAPPAEKPAAPAPEPKPEQTTESNEKHD